MITDQARQPYIGWYPHPSDTNPKLQINLPETTAVHALIFQATLASCPSTDHDFGMEAYLETFDLQYVIPGDNTGTLVTYDQVCTYSNYLIGVMFVMH